MEHARTIVEPARQAMPAELESTLTNAAAAWDRGDARGARTSLEAAAGLAARDGYL